MLNENQNFIPQRTPIIGEKSLLLEPLDLPIIIEPLNAPDLDPTRLEGFNYFSLRVLVDDVVSLYQVVVRSTPCQSLLEIVLIQQFTTESKMSRVHVRNPKIRYLEACIVTCYILWVHHTL